MEPEEPYFIVGIPIYQGVDLLDVAAPYEIFNWMGEYWNHARELKVYLVAETSVALTRTPQNFRPGASTQRPVGPRWRPVGVNETDGRSDVFGFSDHPEQGRHVCCIRL